MALLPVYHVRSITHIEILANKLLREKLRPLFAIWGSLKTKCMGAYIFIYVINVSQVTPETNSGTIRTIINKIGSSAKLPNGPC